MLDRVLLIVIRVATCLILLTPLLVTRTTFFPYIFGKMIAFQILVEISVCAWTLLILRSRQYLPRWRNPIVLTFTLYIATVFASTFFSMSPQASWWSSQERMTGVVSVLHLWVWFVLLHSCFRTRAAWRSLLTISLLSSILVGLYGVAQRLGFPFVMPNATSERLASTLGNPIYLGIYALMHIFVAAHLATIEKRPIRLFFLAGAGLFNCALLIFSYSRGVFFVLLLSVFLFLIGGALIMRRVLGMRAVIGLCLIVASSLSIVIWARSPGGHAWLQNRTPPAFQRIIQKNIVDPDRLQLWNIALRGFFDRPLFGWGNENFNLVYYKYTRPFENGINLQQAWFDRSHNQIIDVLVLYGLIGLIFFTVFWVVLIASPFRLMRQSTSLREQFGLLILCLFFIAYFIQNLSVFDSTVPLILFYFMAAFAAYRCSRESESAVVDPTLLSEESWRSSKKIVAAQVCIVSVTVFGISYFNLTPLAKSKEGIQAIIAANQGRYRDSYDLFSRSLSNNSFTHQEIRRHLATTVLENITRIGGTTAQLRALHNFAIDNLIISIREQPYEIRNHLILSQLYRVKGLQDRSSFQSSIDVLNKALAFAPYRLDLYYELSQTYAASGDQAKAASVIEQAEHLKKI